MYFISPLLLSGALIASQDVAESIPTPTPVKDAQAVSTPPLELTTTVFVTVIRTLCPVTSYPTPSYPPPTAKPSSHFTYPPSVNQEGQHGEQPSFAYATSDFLAGPIYRYTSLAPAKMHTASFAEYSGDEYVTGQPQFTFATSLAASTTIPFEGHYTPIASLETKSTCDHRSIVTGLSTSSAVSTPSYPSSTRSNPGYDPRPFYPSPTRSNPGYDPPPSLVLYTASSQPYAGPTRSGTGYASSPAQPTAPEETMDILPIPTPTETDFSMPPLPDAENTMDILPLPTDKLTPASPSAHPQVSDATPMAEFTWPTTSLDIDIDTSTSTSSDDMQSEGTDDTTAWSGVDNAIPAQMPNRARQARTLPWLSPPPLHSSSAAGRRVWRFWPDVFKRGSVEEASKDNTNGRIEKSGGGSLEKRDCTPCADEGKVRCQGGVAIGYCRGGCEQSQFLGSGPGNECTSNRAMEWQVEVRSAVAMIALLLYFWFVF